jgi:hypothetical protein
MPHLSTSKANSRRSICCAILAAVAASTLLAQGPTLNLPPPPDTVPGMLKLFTYVRDLFFPASKSSNKDSYKEVLQALKEIDKNIEDIQRKLDNVMNVLGTFEVRTIEKLNGPARSAVMGNIRQIHQHYPSWANPNWPELARTRKDIPPPESLLQSLRNATRVLYDQGAYADYSVMALGMVYERILLGILHVPSSDANLRAGFRQYAQYFAAVAGKSGDDTVGGRIARSSETESALHKSLKSLEPLYCGRGKTITCLRENETFLMEHAEELEGTLATGFKKRTDRFGDRYIPLRKSSVNDHTPCPLADQHIPIGTMVDRCVDNAKTLAPLIEKYKSLQAEKVILQEAHRQVQEFHRQALALAGSRSNTR